MTNEGGQREHMRDTLPRPTPGVLAIAVIAILSLAAAGIRVAPIASLEPTTQPSRVSTAPGSPAPTTRSPLGSLASTTPTAPGSPAPTTPPTSATAAPPPAVLVGAGDIASCASSGDEATADLLERIE